MDANDASGDTKSENPTVAKVGTDQATEWIYFIEGEGTDLVKIGHARDPRRGRQAADVAVACVMDPRRNQKSREQNFARCASCCGA
jgi:hypothetical protein